ncbi:MAG TPA: DUF5994 family protein [Mycobacterium sp.]|nr:DUF5994 family protein [Mycobacterium sp.]
MTLQQARSAAGRHPTPPEHTPRLRLKSKAPRTGHVDGAWWPWSDTLTTELPDLLAVLSVRLGSIQRVRYNLGEWAVAPAKLVAHGQTVRLDGHQRQPANTLEVLGAGCGRITLLVVSAHTDPDQAHETMMTAAARGNDSSVDALLMISGGERETRTQRTRVEERWASEGGALD